MSDHMIRAEFHLLPTGKEEVCSLLLHSAAFIANNRSFRMLFKGGQSLIPTTQRTNDVFYIYIYIYI